MSSLKSDAIASVAFAVIVFFSECHSRIILPPFDIGATQKKDSDCVFHVLDKNNDLSPLLVNASRSKNPKLIYPERGDNEVAIGAGNHVGLLCPGEGNQIVSKSWQSEGIETKVYCTHSRQVYTESGPQDIPDISCKKPFRSQAKRSGKQCGGNHTEILIGFPQTDDFVSTYIVCFDDQLKTTLFTRHLIRNSVKSSAKGVPRPSFDPDTFYDGIPVNDLYKQKTQQQTLARILNSTALAQRYVVPKSSVKYLARGHLAPKADFVYPAEQKSTFYFMNTAPQWGGFNAGNWNNLEASVRDLADKLDSVLEVYTGTYGVSTLPDSRGIQQELYLYDDENNNKAIPVPKVYWKAVYDRRTKSGVVVVGVNNPYVNPVPSDYFYCETDVCADIKWLKVNRKDNSKGYVYCCDVNDFRKSVNYLPEFPVKSLLV